MMIFILLYKYTYTHANTQAELRCSGPNGLLTSDFGSSTRGKRHKSYYADHTIGPHKRAAHLVMFKISVGRDLKISNYMPQR